jgi:protoheme IX farnesyltransferase
VRALDRLPAVSDTTTLVPPPAPPLASTTARARTADYVELLKPRIMLLIVVTTVGAMAFAAGGWPSTALVLETVLGMCLASGGSSALNHWYDRDLAARMQRTRNRPIPAGRIRPNTALAFGLALGLAGVAELALLVNWLTAFWAATGFVTYVLVYTVWLKRSTWQNIVWGGAAGAVPPLVGWAAVTGRVDLAPVVLFAVIFLWTPPHFWSLAILLEEDYRRADVPMLPSVAGAEVTARQIAAYTAALLAVSLVLVATGDLGVIYAVAATALGARFVFLAARLVRTPERAQARVVFLYSLLYLAALFAAMGLDRALLG